MRAVIEMKDVNKRFGNKEIFRSVSLDIEEGSTVGFVGENGSGKSVLFQIMAGLIPVDSGTVTVRGEVLGDKKDFPDSVGILINDPGYIEYLY